MIAAAAPADKDDSSPALRSSFRLAEKQPDGSLLAKVMYVGRGVTPAM